MSEFPTSTWRPEAPKLRPVRLLTAWLTSAVVLLIVAGVLRGVTIDGLPGALLVAAIIAALNAIVPPLLAALRLPATLVLGSVLLILLNALMIQWAADITDNAITVDSFGAALALAFATAAVTVAISVVFGSNDDDEYSFRVVRRIARRQGRVDGSTVPGLLFLEIDGLALPVLRRAMQSGHAPNMARWVTDGSHELLEWETDLSSQTGASQAGILLGSNDGIPAFRWVEKERGVVVSCSSPDDCALIESRLADGHGLLTDGGASRGNLLSGEADEQILTISRLAAEVHANPGYRAFLANSFNITRSLVLFAAEVWIELVAARRQRRWDIRPRGHRGGTYPLLRAAMCVIVRDVIVQAVLTDIMRGRPVVYATFSSYDEVAHHSGLERPDTLEALRKLDQLFGRIDRARRYAPRPYKIVVLSDHGQTQGATFLQRNGHGLEGLVEDSIDDRRVMGVAGGDETATMAGQAFDEATGRKARDGEKKAESDVSGRDAVVLGSGNLGLVYLMEESRRLTLEEMEERHPRLIPALREHPHIGWLLVRSSAQGPLVLGPNGSRRLRDGVVEGEDPLAAFSPTAAQHLLRTDGFEHVADIMVGSFYDDVLQEGCAFEELISFHGGLGGPQTRPFVLHPAELPVPEAAIVGCAALHEVLVAWRTALQSQ